MSSLLARKKAIKFTKILAKQFKDLYSDGYDKEELKASLKESVKSLTKKDVRSEILENLNKYTRKLEKFLKVQTPNDQKKEELKSIPYNLYLKDGSELQKLEDTSGENKEILVNNLVAERILEQPDVVSLVDEFPSETGAFPEMSGCNKLFRLTCGCKHAETLRQIMLKYFRTVQPIAEDLMKDNQDKRCEDLAKEIKDFVCMCHLRKKHCTEADESKWPSYEVILGSLLSFYVDLKILSSRSVNSTKKKAKQLCGLIMYLLPCQQHQLDLLLNLTMLTEEDADLLRPLTRSVLKFNSENREEAYYLKYVLTFRALHDKMAGSVSGIVESTKAIPAPKKFMSWLRGQDRQLAEEFPGDKGFKKTLVTSYLLEDATEDQIEGLLEIFVHKDDDIEEQTTSGEMSSATDLQKKDAAETYGFFLDTGGISLDKSNKSEESGDLFFIDKSGLVSQDKKMEDEGEGHSENENEAADTMETEDGKDLNIEQKDTEIFVIDTGTIIRQTQSEQSDNNEDLESEECDEVKPVKKIKRKKSLMTKNQEADTENKLVVAKHTRKNSMKSSVESTSDDESRIKTNTIDPSHFVKENVKEGGEEKMSKRSRKNSLKSNVHNDSVDESSEKKNRRDSIDNLLEEKDERKLSKRTRKNSVKSKKNINSKSEGTLDNTLKDVSDDISMVEQESVVEKGNSSVNAGSMNSDYDVMDVSAELDLTPSNEKSKGSKRVRKTSLKSESQTVNSKKSSRKNSQNSDMDLTLTSEIDSTDKVVTQQLDAEINDSANDDEVVFKNRTVCYDSDIELQLVTDVRDQNKQEEISDNNTPAVKNKERPGKDGLDSTCKVKRSKRLSESCVASDMPGYSVQKSRRSKQLSESSTCIGEPASKKGKPVEKTIASDPKQLLETSNISEQVDEISEPVGQKTPSKSKRVRKTSLKSESQTVNSKKRSRKNSQNSDMDLTLTSEIDSTDKVVTQQLDVAINDSDNDEEVVFRNRTVCYDSDIEPQLVTDVRDQNEQEESSDKKASPVKNTERSDKDAGSYCTGKVKRSKRLSESSVASEKPGNSVQKSRRSKRLSESSTCIGEEDGENKDPAEKKIASDPKQLLETSNISEQVEEIDEQVGQKTPSNKGGDLSIDVKKNSRRRKSEPLHLKTSAHKLRRKSESARPKTDRRKSESSTGMTLRSRKL